MDSGRQSVCNEFEVVVHDENPVFFFTVTQIEGRSLWVFPRFQKLTYGPDLAKKLLAIMFHMMQVAIAPLLVLVGNGYLQPRCPE